MKEKRSNWTELELGKIIRNAIQQSCFFHKKTNTNLGIILLLAPLSVSAGFSFNKVTGVCNLNEMRTNVLEIIKNTTIEDAINVSKGIISANPGGLGKVDKYDLKKTTFEKELVKDNINLYSLMENCKERDTICSELSLGYPITFDVGLKSLERSFLLCKDINLSIVNTYLELLSLFPDSLIKRKFGDKKAVEISTRAKTIVKLGGALTIDGRRELEEFDIELCEEEEKINPGTTADLIASTVFLFLLIGNKI